MAMDAVSAVWTFARPGTLKHREAVTGAEKIPAASGGVGVPFETRYCCPVSRCRCCVSAGLRIAIPRVTICLAL
jgi:hypothetical protein